MKFLSQAAGLLINDLVINHEDVFCGIAKMYELAITCQDDTPFFSGQLHDIPVGGTTRQQGAVVTRCSQPSAQTGQHLVTDEPYNQVLADSFILPVKYVLTWA